MNDEKSGGMELGSNIPLRSSRWALVQFGLHGNTSPSKEYVRTYIDFSSDVCVTVSKF